ncbi:hypothetical protein [Streptomyces sp. Da 82-17]
MPLIQPTLRVVALLAVVAALVLPVAVAGTAPGEEVTARPVVVSASALH